MSKEIKIEIVSIDDLKFQLAEDGNKGDTFSLKNLQDIDFSNLFREIENLKDKKYVELLHKEKNNWTNEFKQSEEFQNLINQKNELQNNLESERKNFSSQLRNKELEITNKLENDYANKKIELEKEISRLIEELKNKDKNFSLEKETLEIANKNFISNLEAKLNEKYSNEIMDLKSKISSLEANLQAKDSINQEKENKLKLEHKNELIEKEQEYRDKYSNENNNLKIENNNLKNQIEGNQKIYEAEKQKLNLEYSSEKERIKLENSSQIEKLNSEHQQVIIKLKSEWESEKTILLNERSKMNSKVYGEDLENYIDSQFKDNMGMLEDCCLEKTTKDIDGTKPDFLFSVIDVETNKILESVTIEAKSESHVSESSKKNSNYYKKLDTDRKKNGSKFALLISELEPNLDWLIYKVREYDNMFVIRPAYFITFLSLIRVIAHKEKEINTNIIELKNKQEILDNFNKLKNEILDNSLSKMTKQMEDIKKKSEAIKKNAEEIEKSATIVLETHINTFKNKINNFKIENIVKKMENI